jgi:hypothetical protein
MGLLRPYLQGPGLSRLMARSLARRSDWKLIGREFSFMRCVVHDTRGLDASDGCKQAFLA